HGRLPSFPTRRSSDLLISPNLLDDMHDGSIAQGDTWLRNNLDGYVQWAKTHNSLLVITYDEDDGSANNRIPTLLVGPMIRPGVRSEEHTSELQSLRHL